MWSDETSCLLLLPSPWRVLCRAVPTAKLKACLNGTRRSRIVSEENNEKAAVNLIRLFTMKNDGQQSFVWRRPVEAQSFGSDERRSFSSFFSLFNSLIRISVILYLHLQPQRLFVCAAAWMCVSPSIHSLYSINIAHSSFIYLFFSIWW